MFADMTVERGQRKPKSPTVYVLEGWGDETNFHDQESGIPELESLRHLIPLKSLRAS
jgi:hypothetical protein